jgi:pyruvate,orthophosphate dikinase
MPRYVYSFGAGQADGRGDQRDLLGGKGANLAEMTLLGIPVPPGFTLTTEVCAYIHAATNPEGALPDGLAEQVTAALARVGELSGTRFGDAEAPLLVSVRSGAPMSMPGMMDTVLNLGLNEDTVKALAKQTGDPRFAYDCYRRFVAMYGDVVLGVGAESEREASPFARLLDDKKQARRVDRDVDLGAEDLRSLVTEYKIEILRRTEAPFPEDPRLQLWGAIRAVFRSWQNVRAQTYRRLHGISSALGTAVNVQAMVFGNLGADCATGVVFTRNPSTGERALYGEFLANAQGEDVVAGVRTPDPIADLAEHMPKAHQELLAVCERLERHFKSVQDLEFTIQRGRLWMLQTRTGKLSGQAMVRAAVDMVEEKLIDVRDAILRIEPGKLDEVLHPTIDPEANVLPVARGGNASPGAAIGRVVFTASDAEAWVERGETVILVRTETSPEDIHGMKAAAGILTARGGMTSHAAVVARGMGKPCVTGCSAIRVDLAAERFAVGKTQVRKGDPITIDGSTGDVYVGAVPLVPARLDEPFETLMGWVDEVRRLRVRTNADTATDARTARAFGAEGIGLCRTEHMFFEPARVLAFRKMILAETEADRRAALAEILPMQRADFVDIFRVMHGLPVTIRLLDPPLHEFLPQTPAEIAEVARELGVTPMALTEIVDAHREANPMLGHRGCRLAISFPEIYQTQARAIAEAAVEVMQAGVEVCPEIMIPFVCVAAELGLLRAQVATVVDAVLAEAELALAYSIGTMIELPRACMVGDRIAEHADFFSFGTNDLTQTTYGFSRDDAGTFLKDYLERGVLAHNPFVSLDRDGVGGLIRIAVEKGRGKKTKLKIGICGEHGGDPASVEFCHVEGLDYVSCSPFRVPIARLAAARAALRGDARQK